MKESFVQSVRKCYDRFSDPKETAVRIDPDKMPDPGEYMDPLVDMAGGDDVFLKWITELEQALDDKQEGASVTDLHYEDVYTMFEAQMSVVQATEAALQDLRNGSW